MWSGTLEEWLFLYNDEINNDHVFLAGSLMLDILPYPQDLLLGTQL